MAEGQPDDSVVAAVVVVSVVAEPGQFLIVFANSIAPLHDKK